MKAQNLMLNCVSRAAHLQSLSINLVDSVLSQMLFSNAVVDSK